MNSVKFVLVLGSLSIFLCFSNCSSHSTPPSDTFKTITVTPANPSVLKLSTQQFTATGTYSDNTTKDITSSVTWSSGTTSIATVSAGGLVTGVSVGAATITATFGRTSGDTTITVTAAASFSKWTRLTGATGVTIDNWDYPDNTIYGSAVDSSGNSYAVGFTDGSIDGQSLTGSTDAFIIKYNSDGVKQWTKLLGVGTGGTEGHGIALDSSRNIYITGTTAGDLGGKVLTGSNDVFVAKYNSSGVIQWVELLGTAAEYSEGFAITVDPSGNSYVTGITTATGFDSQTATGSENTFVIKYDVDGNREWTKLYGGTYSGTGFPEWTFGWGIAVDPSGNSYVTGFTRADLEGHSLVGQNDMFVIKHNSSGTKQWIEFIEDGSGGTGIGGHVINGYNVTVDSSGNSYVLGYTDGLLPLGLFGGALLAKYDPSGTQQWIKKLGAEDVWANGYGVALDPSGNIYVSGGVFPDGSSSFDGQTIIGEEDAFVIECDPSGEKRWTKLLGVAGSYTEANSVSVDSSGHTYVGGLVDGGPLDGQPLNGIVDQFVTTRMNP